MSVDFPIIVNALRKKVFNHTVAKTYLKLKQIAQLKTYDEGYQRKRDSEHEAKIIKYLEKSSNRYLPDIILVIRHDEIKFEEKVLLNNAIFKINEDINGILKAVPKVIAVPGVKFFNLSIVSSLTELVMFFIILMSSGWNILKAIKLEHCDNAVFDNSLGL